MHSHATTWFAVLLAWTPVGDATKDSGVVAATTQVHCHEKAEAFAQKHGTPIQHCKEVSNKTYKIISSGEVDFDYSGNTTKRDTENDKLRKALLEIGKWHKGKTKDSQRVRAIIKEALQ